MYFMYLKSASSAKDKMDAIEKCKNYILSYTNIPGKHYFIIAFHRYLYTNHISSIKVWEGP